MRLRDECHICAKRTRELTSTSTVNVNPPYACRDRERKTKGVCEQTTSIETPSRGEMREKTLTMRAQTLLMSFICSTHSSAHFKKRSIGFGVRKIAYS